MKIESVETFVLSIPFDVGAKGLMFAGKPWEKLGILLVKVTTSDGLSGWGEAFGHSAIPSTRAALESVVAPLFVGRDPRDIESVMRDATQVVHLLGRNGPHVFALSGIDIALWDLAGKRAGKPLYKLLGAERGGELEGYASLPRYTELPLVKQATACAAQAGYKYIKLHEITREAVLAAQNAAPGAKIMLDTNCPWTPAEGVRMAQSMRGDGLYWLEEPVWPPEDFDGLAQVRAEGIPVTAGENAQGFLDFKRMLDAEAVDIVQPSVIKIGGISEMLRIIELAESRGVPVIPHSPYFGPGFLATLHLGAVMKRRPLIEAMWMDMEPNPFDPWVRQSDGRFTIPNGNGLGCDPDPALLARYTV